MKTIAGRLVREMERKLPGGLYQTELALFKKVLAQKRNDIGKIYSLKGSTGRAHENQNVAGFNQRR